MKIKDGFILREVCGEKVIVGEGIGAIDFGKLLSLNDTAAWIWEEAGRQGDFDAGSLAGALCRFYEVDRETAFNDTKKLLDQWLELGIVE